MKRNLAIIPVLLIACALAEQLGWTQGKNKAPESDGATSVSAPTFATADKGTITSWFAKNGLKKPSTTGSKHSDRSATPDSQLHQGSPLPPGFQKQLTGLPAELEKQLAALPAGYHRYIVSHSVIWVKDDTGVVHDLLLNVVP